MVNGFDFAPLRPDKHELEPKPVLTADNLLLGLVVVGRGAHVPENHLRNPNVVFGMLLNVDSVAVVRHRNHSVVGNRDVDVGNRHRIWLARIHRLAHANLVVSAVHDPLVEQLVESRNDIDLLGHYNTLRVIVHVSVVFGDRH